MSARNQGALTLRAQRNDEGLWELSSPAVGRFRPLARFVGAQAKSLCLGGDELGSLERLGERLSLKCPLELPAGQITLSARGLQSVGWGQLIATLTPAELSADEGAGASGSGAEATEGWAIEAPIDGTVYYAPSPESPPFVEPGALIEPGQVVALVEVMKFFYEIKHEGDSAVRALSQGAAHGSPIEAGAALWRVTSPS